MEIAVVIKNKTDSNGSYKSKLKMTATIWIIAPKAKNKIVSEDLFIK
jgi:hypothetical protein